MNRRIIIILGLLLLIILAVLCLTIHPKKIESKLTSLSADALKSAGIEDVSVNFNGRECTLTGTVNSEEQSIQAVKILDGIKGVRSVTNHANIPIPDVKKVMNSQITQKDSVGNIRYELSKKLSENHILFATNSSHPVSSSGNVLAHVAELLKIYTDQKIEIAGHTDSCGTQAYNQKLSLRRAQSVKEILVKGGEKPDRFVIKGYGESIPVAENTTSESMEKYRRVEFIIVTED